MSNTINHLENAPKLPSSINIREPLECADGFKISIQASEFHYSSPRENVDPSYYEAVELGFPSEPDELILSYAEDPEKLTETVYGWVPVSLVDELIKKHGGPKQS